MPHRIFGQSINNRHHIRRQENLEPVLPFFILSLFLPDPSTKHPSRMTGSVAVSVRNIARVHTGMRDGGGIWNAYRDAYVYVYGEQRCPGNDCLCRLCWELVLGRERNVSDGAYAAGMVVLGVLGTLLMLVRMVMLGVLGTSVTLGWFRRMYAEDARFIGEHRC
ncbi:hypothetical protein IQ07DRAFT_370245 [Pyrenochaeta sp. DS3sAY3a]|nr:hypothetical protein IQ07DRAFT_370245 [Pyrenochaeta sp. DS3sAY3a]